MMFRRKEKTGIHGNNLEFYRAFHSGEFIAALIIGAALSIYQAVMRYVYYKTYMGMSYSGITIWTQNLFNEAVITPSSALMRFLAPFLVCLPHGLSYWRDMRQGYGKNLLTREKRSQYLKDKWLAAVGSGITVLYIPYFLNFLLCGLFLPITNAEVLCRQQGLHPHAFLVRLFYENTFLYAAFYFALFALFAAVCVTFALALSTFAEYWFSCLFGPFLVCLVLYNVASITSIPMVAPFYFLDPNQPNIFPPIPVIGSLLAAVVIFGCFYYGRGMKNDVF